MSRRKRYSAEFKREALRRANEPGVTDVLVAEELGISARQLRRWRDAVNRDGDAAFPGQGKSRDEEITQLKRKLAKVEQEPVAAVAPGQHADNRDQRGRNHPVYHRRQRCLAQISQPLAYPADGCKQLEIAARHHERQFVGVDGLGLCQGAVLSQYACSQGDKKRA